jgi:hypothetical protein
MFGAPTRCLTRFRQTNNVLRLANAQKMAGSTGDAVEVDGEYICFLGRKSEMINE